MTRKQRKFFGLIFLSGKSVRLLMRLYAFGLIAAPVLLLPTSCC
jgi:hypothetical protein